MFLVLAPCMVELANVCVIYSQKELVVHSKSPWSQKPWLSTMKYDHQVNHMNGGMFHARLCVLTVGQFPHSQNSV